MIHIDEKRFRAGVAIAFALYAVWNLEQWLVFFSVSPGAAFLFDWDGIDAVWPAPVRFWLYVIQVVLAVGSFIGCFFYWKPARWILAAVIISGPLTGPFLGIMVDEPRSAALGVSSLLAECWVVFACFWTPIAERFAYKPEDIWMRRIKGA